jgi:RND family efflux transporter MFP subunit
VDQPSQGGAWKLWTFVGMLAICPLVVLVAYLAWPGGPGKADGQEAPPSDLRVDVIHPEKGKMPRTTHMPGTVLSFDWAQLYAEVSGYLKTETVDIGDHVTKDQVLIQLDVPDRVAQLHQAEAAIDQANARVTAADARLDTANADLKAAQAKVVQANATARSTLLWRRFRESQLQRMKELYASRSIEERLLEESQEQAEAAAETERAARAGIKTAEAEEEAANAKIKQAKADIATAKSDVRAAVAAQEKAQVMVDFATIRAPYDGYITQRSKLPGDFVKAADEGAAGTPLLTVERTYKMRVVVQVPDRDVPYCQPGCRAAVEIDALPGKEFEAKVSRIARSEDTGTKLMHVEIDVDNPTREIRQGMFGWVTIYLDAPADQLSLPSTALASRAQGGKATIWVVREGRARLVPVRVGTDNGERVAIESGLSAHDLVIAQGPPGLQDGMPVVTPETRPGSQGGGR